MTTQKKHHKQNHHKVTGKHAGHHAHHKRRNRIAKWAAIFLAGIMLVSAFAGFFVVKW